MHLRLKSKNNKKEDIVYIFKEIFLIHEKKGNPAIYDNTDECGRYYAQWTKSEKNEYYITSLVCGI